MITIDKATKSWAGAMVLNEVTLHIKKSSIIGLAGSSGAGKSTLLRCIQQLESLDSGRIVCEGTSGFMFQDFQLFPHMTVLKNLTYAPRLHDKTVDHTIRATMLLDQLGIGDKIQEYPHTLSGGQKQRVALARSLMMHPDILLCDEPTSGLDVATMQDVVSLLSHVRDLGVTMVIASHDLDFLTQIADRIVLFKEGKIVADIEPHQTHNAVMYLKKLY